MAFGRAGWFAVLGLSIGSALPLRSAVPQALVGANAFTPPACSGEIPDVDNFDPFCGWIRQLLLDGISEGCGGGLYCPDAPVTRRQVARLLERAMRGTDTWTPLAEGAACDAHGARPGTIWQYWDLDARAHLVCELDEVEDNGDFGVASLFSGFRGGSVRAAISPAADQDYFLVQATSTTLVAETMSDIVGGPTCDGGMDTVLTLFNFAMVQIATDDEGGTNSCSKISAAVTAGNLYYLKVEDYQNDSLIPAYRLVVTTF